MARSQLVGCPPERDGHCRAKPKMRFNLAPAKAGASIEERLMTLPDASKYNKAPEYARELIQRIQAAGKSQRWIAERIGVSERRIRYLLNGERVVSGEKLVVTMSYTEQYAFEQLVSAAETKKLD